MIQNHPLCKTLTNQDGHHQHILSHATTATTFSTYAPAMDVRPLHSTMVLHPNCIIPQAHLPGLRQHASRGPHDSISIAQSSDRSNPFWGNLNLLTSVRQHSPYSMWVTSDLFTLHGKVTVSAQYPHSNRTVSAQYPHVKTEGFQRMHV